MRNEGSQRETASRDTFIMYFLHKKYDKCTVFTFCICKNIVIIIISFDVSNYTVDDLIGQNVNNY